MLVRTGLPRTGSLDGEHPPAADLALLVGADREQLAAGLAREAVVEGELEAAECRSGSRAESPARELAVLRSARRRRPRRRRPSAAPRDACAPPPGPRRAGCGRRPGSRARSGARVRRLEPLVVGEARDRRGSAPSRSGRRRSAARSSPAQLAEDVRSACRHRRRIAVVAVVAHLAGARPSATVAVARRVVVGALERAPAR